MENKKEKSKDEEQLEELERLGKEIDQIRITQNLVNRNPNIFRKPENNLLISLFK
jgi:archaellum component FlaC